MKITSFTLCVFALLALGSNGFDASTSRRDLQSVPWALDVEQLSGSCDDADAMYNRLWIDASNLCSSTINRMTPPAICKQQNSESCPPGVETDCPDVDVFNKLCTVRLETCYRTISQRFLNALIGLIPFGEVGKMGEYTIKASSATVTAALDTLDIESQILYGKGVEEAKLAFRKLFHDYPDMLMEMVEHSFSQPEQREKMSEDWSKVSQRTQQTILAHACRREADKALRYVNFDTLMDDMKSKAAFYDTSVGNQAGCTDIFGDDDTHLFDNQSLDCLNMASTFAEIFDPTEIIAFLVSHATDVDYCPDIHDPNDLHYNPRATLSNDHPWHLVKEKLVERLILGATANTPYVKDSRGDGESMSHHLKRKMLSEACPRRNQFAKGVCRPVSVNQFGKHLQGFFDTAPQLIYVDAGSPSHDQCCDKNGMTTIRTERDCRKAAQELRPWGRYLGRVNKNTIPYGCYADVRTQDVGFNSNRENSNLAGLYEPICGAGVNRYKIREFNIIRAEIGYVMGALGETCLEYSEIVRAEDCEYALSMLSSGASFERMDGNVHEMGGCSLQASESKGLYNDRHPFETQIRRNDPPTGNGQGGSYPICYVAGVWDNERRARLMKRSYYTMPYYFTAPACAPGWRYSGDAKRHGWWKYRAECIQNYWTCDEYPHHILHVGRLVPQPGQPILKSDMPVGYCLDMSKMGNMW